MLNYILLLDMDYQTPLISMIYSMIYIDRNDIVLRILNYKSDTHERIEFFGIVHP